MKFDSYSLSQRITPLARQLRKLSTRKEAAFYAPGHKKGEGIAQDLDNWLGKTLFQSDLPELPELDNLFAPEGVIEQAQQLAANAFGADQTWFLVNGSTCGIIAAIMATCNPGDKIILPRNSHQSAIAGLIFSGAIPIFINPPYNSALDINYSITAEAVAHSLKQHPETKAIMVVYPTYHGICGDIQAIASITHQYNIPLLVDEAHGAHFHFHPELPPSALSLGADLTVQSTHKTLGALTQASMLHIQGNRVNRERLSTSLQLLQSSSPNYILLASLDIARQQIALEGKELLTQTLALAETARSKISQIEGLSVLEIEQDNLGFIHQDKTRLTVILTELGISGYQADEILNEQLGVTAELPMLQHITFIISLGNRARDIEKLLHALTLLASTSPPTVNPYSFPPLSSSVPQCILAPREAYFSATKTMALEKSIGYISAETVCPYPPGIPLLIPGEAIALETVNFLKQLNNRGGTITGCSDTSLNTIRVC